ncbi:LysR family transcriptional regulator, chromosome initiation inhibitor [Shimia gijangensis]|uniref:LysR family transcriptional regulator, chromosome initiation inhibitor n=1 Tax=Shimia gijangensis TaxID=1470563 RepID=A0A1M6PDY9_9RHOB|nr:LysR family transcriptional regulator ArgP [Shimia gijangensis]SHK06134.1 LysR family transcriptional regulator, chromosome initiation inhibitor [Shimia gijangensis]
MQFDYAHLQALAAILRTGSFDGAAAELGVTQSAISQRLKALEDRVGALLVHRGHPCTGTDAGRRLASHVTNVGLLERNLDKDLRSLVPGPDAPVRIAVNADSLATWLLPALANVPDMLFDLVVDDQEYSADWLRRGEVAAAITSNDRAVSGCDCRALGNLHYVATASPDFMQRYFADGVTAQTMSAAPMLRFDPKDYLQGRWMQKYLGRKLTPPSHRLPSPQGFVEASLLGLGWGMNPELLVRSHIASGALVPLLPHAGFDTPLFWQSARLLGDALEPLTRSVQRAAKNGLMQG